MLTPPTGPQSDSLVSQGLFLLGLFLPETGLKFKAADKTQFFNPLLATLVSDLMVTRSV